jgi:uncharacterized cupredoxin-like copper-binding protein
MKSRSDSLGLIAIFLIVFLFAVGVAIWLLDLITQQRIFGLLVGAEFLAFALLVYLYYEETPVDVNRKWLLGGFAALATLVILATTLFAGVGSAPTPNVQVTLYAGEISNTVYGFGHSSASLTSPGPTLTFKVGDVVNMTLINSGQMPHNWALVSTNETDGAVLFHAQIASESSPLQTNQTGLAVFTVTQSGSFFYICQVPGHVQLGMWGNVVVNP